VNITALGQPMKTRKDYIIEFLADGEWKDKGLVCNEISYKCGGYGDSIARTLRKMKESGEIERRDYEDKRGGQYRLLNSPLEQRNTIKVPQFNKQLF